MIRVMLTRKCCSHDDICINSCECYDGSYTDSYADSVLSMNNETKR